MAAARRVARAMEGEAGAKAALGDLLERRFSSGEGVDVLDAGCGSQSQVAFPAGAHVVGIDVSSDQVAANPDVDERIVGDLQTHRFAAGSFDLIVCWDVLEHLRRPEPAVDGLVRALRPGGVLVVKVPNVRSVKGLVTRVTPVWLRFAVAKRILATLPDECRPFPSFHRSSIAPAALASRVERGGLDVIASYWWEADVQRSARVAGGVAGLAWRALERAAGLTGGRVAVEATEFLLVAERP